jgi:hypothetical protein
VKLDWETRLKALEKTEQFKEDLFQKVVTKKFSKPTEKLGTTLTGNLQSSWAAEKSVREVAFGSRFTNVPLPNVEDLFFDKAKDEREQFSSNH